MGKWIGDNAAPDLGVPSGNNIRIPILSSLVVLIKTASYKYVK
jgi:hypothetical protein